MPIPTSNELNYSVYQWYQGQIFLVENLTSYFMLRNISFSITAKLSAKSYNKIRKHNLLIF